MVMSIKEQITELEEQYARVRGPKAKEVRKEIQKKIDELKELDKEPDEPMPEVEQKPRVANKKELPPFRKTTLQEVQEAEKEGKLCGFDPDAMTASIRD